MRLKEKKIKADKTSVYAGTIDDEEYIEVVDWEDVLLAVEQLKKKAKCFEEIRNEIEGIDSMYNPLDYKFVSISDINKFFSVEDGVVKKLNEEVIKMVRVKGANPSYAVEIKETELGNEIVVSLESIPFLGGTSMAVVISKKDWAKIKKGV